MYAARMPKASKKVTPSPEGLAVQRLRSKAGMTQTELGDRIGVAQGYISQIESGEVEHPSGYLLVKIARALDVPISAILPVAPPEEVVRSLEKFLGSGVAGKLTEREESELLSAGQVLGRVPKTRTWFLLLEAIRANTPEELADSEKQGPTGK